MKDGINFVYAVSPDGREVVLDRSSRLPGRPSVTTFLSALDGPEERVLSETVFSTVAWSPDGRTLAAVKGFSARADALAFLDVADGRTVATADVGASRYVLDLIWLDDRQVAVRVVEPSVPNDPAQIWLVSYPEGQARRLTGDPSGFTGISASSDGRTIAATQVRSQGELWTAPAANLSSAVRLLGEEQRVDVAAATGTTVIVKIAGAIWAMRADGSDRRRLTPESLNVSRVPSVSWRGDVVVFEDREKRVWKMTTDGRNLVQVPIMNASTIPIIHGLSPDGTTVFFRTKEGDRMMPVAGGEAVPGPWPSDTSLSDMVYSPDGRYVMARPSSRERLMMARKVVLPAAGGPAIWTGGPETSGYSAWAPAGDAIDQVQLADGVGNIWRYPLAGGEPRRLTDFTEPGLRDFRWSSDGSNLFYSWTRTVSRDVVLITNFLADRKAP
jgi:Tol biopolymer transport system component